METRKLRLLLDEAVEEAVEQVCTAFPYWLAWLTVAAPPENECSARPPPHPLERWSLDNCRIVLVEAVLIYSLLLLALVWYVVEQVLTGTFGAEQQPRKTRGSM